MTWLAQALDGVAEIEIDAEAGLAHAAALVAHLLGVARGHVARHQVAEAGVAALQVVIALGLGNLVGRARVALLLGHPDAAVVAQRLAHQGELRLVVARDRDARRMDLREAGVGEQRAALVGAPDGGGVASPWRWSRGRRRCRSRRCPAPPRRPSATPTWPVIRLRVTMPRAWPSTTTRSSISVRGYMLDARRRRSAAPAPGRRRAATAGRSGRARRTCARPARRRRSGYPASPSIRARTARPGPRTGR